MVAAFPVAKLGVLFLKQLSKPIANFCKQKAKSHPFFRRYICMPPAQFYNWCEVKAKMWLLNLGKPVNVPVLNEAQAIELGANLLGETILFGIAALLLIAEYMRSARSEANKQALIQEEKDEITRQLRDLFIATQEQRAQITELTRYIYEMENRKSGFKRIFKSEEKPPPPPSAPSLIITKVEVPVEQSNVVKSEAEHKNPVLNAAFCLERELWSNENVERTPSLLTVAINYLYKDIYQVPLSI